MYTNNLFNNGNNYQLEMQVHQAFMQTEEGKQAELVFAQSKKDWWEKVNNPNPPKKEDPNETDDKLLELENKLNLIVEALDLNKNKD
ncbi:MAG: hypothetical protein ACK5NF_03245 [Bacilli bacterium]